MKVVLFCGGLGMRLREYSEAIPKPMVHIGYRPILWHVMKYYAHFGHKDFILCLGWRANVIKEFFLGYSECMSNDFVLSSGGQKIKLLNSDIGDWNITFVDTGTTTSIGQRLRAVQPHLEGESTFLANYTDGLCDVDLAELIAFHHRCDSTATFLSVPPSQTFHVVQADATGCVQQLQAVGQTDIWMNGGYFVLSNEIFNYIQPGDDLVEEPFRRLMAENRLHTMKYSGFWSCMDTYKELQMLHELYDRDDTPWTVWQSSRNTGQVHADEVAMGSLQSNRPR